MEIKLAAVQIEKPEPINFILGQTHFIKSAEDEEPKDNFNNFNWRNIYLLFFK